MRSAGSARVHGSSSPAVQPRFITKTDPIAIEVAGEEFVPVTRLLQQLNRPVIVEDLAGRVGISAGRAPAAALVSDAVDRPLERCRELAATCPVILVSDQTSFAFRLAAARAQVSALIRRPIAATELSEWLDHLASREATRVSVLIVDDDVLSSEINAEVLRSAGMSVKVAGDLAAVLDLIEEVSPDIVLMDVRMPGVDGVELAQIIRQSMHFVSLPIIFLSGERDEARQLSARRFGGDDFILKPVPPARLVSIVRMRADRSRVLRSLIERDRLTGLLDHTRFKERLALDLERCRRSAGDLCLAMIDIDHFKRVNDAHGHAVGDDVLRTLADVLQAGPRPTDAVGRCGGEEFGIIMPGAALDEATAVVETLRQRFGAIRFGGAENAFSVTFSAGVASSRQTRIMPDLVAAADAALYRAKAEGRDRVVATGSIQTFALR